MKIRTERKQGASVDVFKNNSKYATCETAHVSNLVCLALGRSEMCTDEELEGDLTEYQHEIKDWMIGHSNRLNKEGKTPQEIAVSIWTELYENELLSFDAWKYAKRTGEIEQNNTSKESACSHEWGRPIINANNQQCKKCMVWKD